MLGRVSLQHLVSGLLSDFYIKIINILLNSYILKIEKYMYIINYMEIMNNK